MSLIIAGQTTNFIVQYENTLPNQANVIANANALLPVPETEFTVTTGWFNTPGGKFGAGQQQVVNLNLQDTSTSGGTNLPGANNSGYGRAINLDAQNLFTGATAAERVKNVFMAEWSEILMSLTNNWHAGDSSGEALSQYCSIIRFPAGHYSYYGSWVNNWLKTSRPDWVTKTEPTDKNPVSFGCALAFIFYLNTQLGFTINQIIAAGSANLAQAYTALTGDHANPFPLFHDQLGIIYPGAATIIRPNLDNPYPIGKKVLWHNGLTDETQIWFMNDEWIARRATVVDENGAAIFVGPPWRIVGTTDMTKDGQADIVWHNSFTYETQVWFMNGERIKRRATVVDENGAAIFVGPPWRIVGTDMTKDGQADIVWHNSFTDETQIWFMNAERIKRRATVVDENGAAIFVGPPWRIVGAGDLYGDASSDILWHNSLTNDIQFWFMNGPQIKGRNGVTDEHGNIIQVGDPWHIAGVAGLASETASMSRPANPYDHASCESFMKTLKREEIYANNYNDLEHLRANIEEFIEQYYNRLRVHSALGYRSPEEFVQQIEASGPAESRSATMVFFENKENSGKISKGLLGERDSDTVPFPRPLLLLGDTRTAL